MNRLMALAFLLFFAISPAPSVRATDVHGANLIINRVFAAQGPGGPVLPGINEIFYVHAWIANTGDQDAKNFTAVLDATWQGVAGSSPQDMTIHYDSLSAGQINDSGRWGPFRSPQPANLTLTAQLNPDHAVSETSYSDNVLTVRIPIGDLFNVGNALTLQALWSVSESQNFTPAGTSIPNFVYGAVSGDGKIALVRTDSGHLRVLNNGKVVSDLQIGLDNGFFPSLSPSGRYVALGFYYKVQVYDLNKSASSPVFSRTVSQLNMSLVILTAISDRGVLALAGSGKSTGGNDLVSFGSLTEVDTATGKVLWSENFDKDLLNLGQGQYYTNWISSLAFDDAGDLVVGVRDAFSSPDHFSLAILHEPHAWLYLFYPDGSVAWKSDLPSSVVSGMSAVSTNGNSIMVGTYSGLFYFFDRHQNLNLTIYHGLGVESGQKYWNYPVQFTLSPEGDCVVISDSRNIYVLNASGTPLIKFPVANVTGLSMGSGYLLVGRVGGAMMASLWGPVNDTISEASAGIDSAKSKGADVARAEGLLTQAQSAQLEGDWFQAYNAATQAITAAEEATASVTQTTSTSLSTSSSSVGISQQPIPSGLVAAIALVVVLGAVVAFVFLRRRRNA